MSAAADKSANTDEVIYRSYELTNSIVVQSRLTNVLSGIQLSLVYTPSAGEKNQCSYSVQ